MLNLTITERIFVALAQKRLSQKEFAKRIEVNEKTVSAWKKNNSLPPADKISKISDCLGVTINYLLTGEEEKPVIQQSQNFQQINSREKELLKYFKMLSNEEQIRLIARAEVLAEQAKLEENVG